MLGEAEFRVMKPSAYYICFSRGGIADDAALLRALNEGWIAGAGLDAHSQEPLPPDSPFWTAPNTIITPHNGATTPADPPARRRHLRREPRAFSGGEPFGTSWTKSQATESPGSGHPARCHRTRDVVLTPSVVLSEANDLRPLGPGSSEVSFAESSE